MSSDLATWKRPNYWARWVVFAIGAIAVLGASSAGDRVLGVTLLIAAWIPTIVRNVRKRKYFDGDVFRSRKEQISAFVNEHNELADYIGEIRDRGSFAVGRSDTGQHAHLAQSYNTSRHNYKRDRNVASLGAPNVHNCSLQVVRNASAEPIKYVMKYFGIKADEATLAQVEDMGSSIANLEEAVVNLRQRESEIASQIDPPWFVKKHFMDEFLDQVGVHLSPVTVPYPVYVFEYTSAGGNSAQRTMLTLNTPTIDALVHTMSEKIRFRKSVAGQRALMTARLRNFIKERDNHACKQCGISIHVEPHLLLEIDHIIPLSRGGLTAEENLQTLCWKCNRSKSNKLL